MEIKSGHVTKSKMLPFGLIPSQAEMAPPASVSFRKNDGETTMRSKDASGTEEYQILLLSLPANR
jgi:hypothetical protein